MDEQQTKLDEDIIDILSKDPELRVSIQKKLERLKHKDAIFL